MATIVLYADPSPGRGMLVYANDGTVSHVPGKRGLGCPQVLLKRKQGMESHTVVIVWNAWKQVELARLIGDEAGKKNESPV